MIAITDKSLKLKAVEPTETSVKSAVEKPFKLLDLLMLLAVVISWGVAFTAMKETIHNAPPFKAAGVRFILAALPLLFFALRPARLRRLTRPDLARYALLGFLQTTLMFGINYTALQFVPAGISSIILNTHPFFVALLAHRLLAGDRLSKTKLIGLGLGFGGVLVIVLGGKGIGDVALYWPLLLLFSAMVWGLSSVLLKKFQIKDVVSFSAWQTLFGALPLLVVGFGFESQPIQWNFTFIGWTLYAAFIASAFAWWAWATLLGRYNASRVTVFGFLVPVFGVLSATVFLGETLTPAMLIGGSFVAMGIVLVNRRKKAGPPRPQTA